MNSLPGSKVFVGRSRPLFAVDIGSERQLGGSKRLTAGILIFHSLSSWTGRVKGLQWKRDAAKWLVEHVFKEVVDFCTRAVQVLVAHQQRVAMSSSKWDPVEWMRRWEIAWLEEVTSFDFHWLAMDPTRAEIGDRSGRWIEGIVKRMAVIIGNCRWQKTGWLMHWIICGRPMNQWWVNLHLLNSPA